MGKWKHRLTSINKTLLIANCEECGNNIKIVADGHKSYLRCKYARHLGRHHLTKNRHRAILINMLKTYSCFKCNLEKIDIRFFDVNHINANHKDNSLINLELLCPNCHRIETLRQTDIGIINKKTDFKQKTAP